MNIYKALPAIFIALTLSQESIAVTSGKNIYSTACSGCHQLNGSGLAGVFPPLNSTAITSLQETVKIVVNGESGTAMAAYGLQLNQQDLVSVISYIVANFSDIKTTNNTIQTKVSKQLTIAKKEEKKRKKRIAALKAELHKLPTPNKLFAKSYAYENRNVTMARTGYNLLISKFPDSDLMLKAIERLDKINSKYKSRY